MKPSYKILVRFIFAGLVLVTAVFLFGDLNADPPGDIDHSAGLVFDPPSKCQTARNKVLYGEWRTDEWTPYLHGLLHTLIQTFVFKCFGSNLITMRLPGAILFLFALLLIAAMIAWRKGMVAGLIALIIAVLNPITLTYGRSGLLEPQLIFWVLLSAWALERAGGFQYTELKGEKIWLFVAGLAASAAFWTKGMGSYFIIAASIVLLVCPPGKRRNTIYFFIPILISFVLYFGPFMTINKPFFDREASYWLKRAHHADLWWLWYNQPIFHDLGASRWLFSLGLLTIPTTWLRYENKTDTPVGLRVLGVMILIGLQVTALMNYRPLRYYVLVFVASIPLSAWLIAYTLDWARNPDGMGTRTSWRRLPIVALTFMLLTYTLNFTIVYSLAARWHELFTFPYRWRLATSAGVALILLLIWWVVRKRVVSRLAKGKLSVRMAIVALMWSIILTPILIYHAVDIRFRVLNRTHQMHDFSKRLGEEYRNMLVAGTSPAFAGVENEHRIRKVTEYGLNHAVMKREALTHLLIPNAWNQPKFFSENFPDTWKRSEEVDKIVISGFEHILYALDRQPPVLGGDGTIFNPDPHSPADVTLIEIPETTESSGSVNLVSISHRLPPGTEWSPGFSGSFRLVDRKYWKRPDLPNKYQNMACFANPTAWEQRSWKFISTQDMTSFAEWDISNAEQVAFIGVRLRGANPPRDGVQCTWKPKDGAAVTWRLSNHKAGTKEYRPYCILLPRQARARHGTFKILLAGKAGVWVDMTLFLSIREWDQLPLESVTHH